jgi:hypothetical protein
MGADKASVTQAASKVAHLRNSPRVRDGARIATRLSEWKIGVGRGGRTLDIQSHSLAFCH